MEIFYGLGYRVRERDYTTYAENFYIGGPVYYAKYTNTRLVFPISEHVQQAFPTLQIGILFGFNVKYPR